MMFENPFIDLQFKRWPRMTWQVLKTLLIQ